MGRRLQFIGYNSLVPGLYVYRCAAMDTLGVWSSAVRDVIRETSKVCCFVGPGVYIYCFLVLVLGESLVFLVLWWVYLHVVLSGWYLVYESISTLESSELAYGAALVLTGAGVAMGTVYVHRDTLGVLHGSVWGSLVCTLVFLLVQYGEYQVLGVYIGDQVVGSVSLVLAGLHFRHVLVGVSLVGVSTGASHCVDITPVDTLGMDIYLVLVCSYWHLVELVYLGIYLCLYCH